MEKIFVADSYKDGTIIGEPFDNAKGKRYVKVKIACPRCGGSGNYSYNQMDGTMCYGCMGSGHVIESVRAYTEKEYNRMVSANAKAKERREAAKEAKKQELIANADKYKHEVALKLGFNENEKVYLIYGDDTYAIKNKLKELGARFDPTLKWFVSNPVELPEGYSFCEMSFDELYDYNAVAKWANFKENAKEIVSKKINELVGPSTSVFYPAAEKNRIRNITAKISNIRGFEGMYGYTYVYTFTSGDYVFVWMTAKALPDMTVGNTVDLTGTIKEFNEYLGVKNTYLTRCVVQKIDE